MSNRNRALRSRMIPQEGFSLLVVLILLVVMSLLGIAVMRSSAMQERMGSNLRDRSLAFQGAETALRYAQNQVLAVPPDAASPLQTWDKLASSLTTAHCTNKGVCDASKGTAAPEVWKSLPGGSYDSKLAAAPEYRIEYIGTGPSRVRACDDNAGEPSVDCVSPMFRVTARSRATGRAEVVLQAIVASAIKKS